jgi:tetratricopeptide (TPR) repeat protein
MTRDPRAFASSFARACAFACACACTLASNAPADTPPTAWDAARDPGARARWDLHVKVERMLHPPIDPETPEWIIADALARAREEARGLLESAGAASSSDVVLRFDLGRIYEQLEHYDQAIAVLAPAVEMAPNHPAVADALSSLASACAHRGRVREEMDAERKFLARTLRDEERITPMTNLGEAEMRMGHVEEALALFEQVEHVAAGLPNTAQRPREIAYALWDEAVALDRLGEPGRALEVARDAMKMQIDDRGHTGEDLIRDDRSIFFEPTWQRDWYLGLLATVRARGERDARRAERWWGEAVRHWETYVTHTEKSDAFLPIAQQHLERARVQQADAAKRAAKLPPPAPAGPSAPEKLEWRF